ncbi:hypothetical protein N8I77_001907 [Diaporthe amygdali]|uniref:Uncharacterized protein n=1 Tax=Phomopsis amygdali TaxID=1214568 RepID=A0AAD9SRU0_PHOAM|nr:hypothetical protein N8I77_001907 [Diaporthe amygdali]
MTGRGAQAAAPAAQLNNPRRHQLARMRALQRILNSLNSCNCPPDCRGPVGAPVQSPRTPPPPPPRSGGDGDSDGDDNDDDDSDGNGDDDGDESRFTPGQVTRRASARINSTVLAGARGTRDVHLEKAGIGARLRASLQVHTDPQGKRTRLGYYADLFCKLDGDDREEHHIGYITSWRLSKPPRQRQFEGNPQPWVEEWLSGDLGSPDDVSRPFKETLRLLYDETGQWKAVENETFQDALSDTGTELVFIDMIWIRHKNATTGFEYSSKRIGAYFLDMFYKLATNGTLPAWYNINLPVTFIMRVGMPSDNSLSELWLDKHPQQPEEDAQLYSDRIGDKIERWFQIVEHYGYIKIHIHHRILAQIFRGQPQCEGLRSLDNGTDPAPPPTEPAPRSVLSTIRS